MSDPFSRLGLARTATADEVRQARRNLAKTHHPDAGGDADLMREVNAAAGQALHQIQHANNQPPDSIDRRNNSAATDADQASAPGWSSERSGLARDVPSFTVEALPAETFEALLVVASWIGDVIDDDPPYVLECHLRQPSECWCRLDVVPDAGASTVSITIAGDADHPAPPIEVVRDLWVDQLNRYDWD